MNSAILRPLADFEKISINPMNQIYVQFALEVTKPEYLQKFLKQMKNAISGLYIKSDGENFINNFKYPENITIHKIPKGLKTLSNICEWIYQAHSPSTDYSLASIAADETRIIINSNHSLTDGGFFVNLLENIQNNSKQQMFSKRAPIPGDLRGDILREKLKEFIDNKDKYYSIFPSLKQKDFTYLNLQEKVSLPDNYDNIPHRFIHELDCNELSSHLYNKETKKMNQMTDFLTVGLCMAINAKNGNYGPIGAASCFDFRRLFPKEKIDFSFGNAFSNYFVSVKNANPSLSVNEMCSLLRKNYNLLNDNHWLCKESLFPFDFLREDCPIAVISNLGKMRFKSPIKDFYLQDTEKDSSCKSIIQLTSYTKDNENDGSNRLVLHLRAANSIVSKKNAQDILETLVYFFKNVRPSMSSGDVFDELVHFQNTL